MRYHALTTLRKALNSAKKALTDSLAKDVLKNMKNGLLDKALPVQRAATGVKYCASFGPTPILYFHQVLIAMFSPEESVTLADVESVVGVCVKTLEGSDQLTRQSIAQLVGHMLAATQVPRVVLAAEIPPKSKKDQEDNDATNPAYVVSENMKPLLTPAEMLLQLSAHFNRPQLSRKVRAGIFDFYVALLTKLGVVFAETNYALIVSHLMSELVSNPKNSATRYDKLFIQKLVGALLRDLVATRMLSEQGQITAIQELSSSYVKRWPALMPGQVAPNSTVLTIVLKEIAELLHQLGNAPPPVQVTVILYVSNLQLSNFLLSNTSLGCRIRTTIEPPNASKSRSPG
jgi:hypothetical protein